MQLLDPTGISWPRGAALGTDYASTILILQLCRMTHTNSRFIEEVVMACLRP